VYQTSYMPTQNSRKSTGPKTAKGKERSKLNATKHGLRAVSFTVKPKERKAFGLFWALQIHHLDPRSHVEYELVRIIAECRWSLRMSLRAETELLRAAHNTPGKTFSEVLVESNLLSRMSWLTRRELREHRRLDWALTTLNEMRRERSEANQKFASNELNPFEPAVASNCIPDRRANLNHPYLPFNPISVE